MVLSRADVPGEQVADAIDGVAGDAGEHVAEVGFGIEAVELGGLDQGIEGSGAITAGVGPGKKVVLPAEGQRPDLPFGGVVIWHVSPRRLRRSGQEPASPLYALGRPGTGGVGSTHGGQAELTMSCELELLSGRPPRLARLRCERGSVVVV